MLIATSAAPTLSWAAMRLYGEIGDDTGRARTHHNLGWLSEVQSRYPEALAHSQQALSLFQSVGDRVGHARASTGPAGFTPNLATTN
jgi:hypothetical protein